MCKGMGGEASFGYTVLRLGEGEASCTSAFAERVDTGATVSFVGRIRCRQLRRFTRHKLAQAHRVYICEHPGVVVMVQT